MPPESADSPALLSAHVIAVGVGDMAAPSKILKGFDKLDYSTLDAQNFAEALEQRGLSSEPVFMDSSLLGEQLPTRNNILRAVYELEFIHPKPLVFYFSGHGIEIDGIPHLCPYDYDPRLPSHSAISVPTLVDIISANVPWALLVIDACRDQIEAPQRIRHGFRMHRGTSWPVHEKICLITSCSSGEKALEIASIDGRTAGSIFTYFFLKRLRARGRGAQVLGRIFQAAQRKTSEFALQQKGLTQTPRISGANPWEIIL